MLAYVDRLDVIDSLLWCGGPFRAGGCGERRLFVSNQTLLL